ncbi:HlyC/CorC family transporter [Paenarthrobacter sp. Z7-10]|nr:hemolysin family protein [Paenarthrobacter sp. Z7-10]MCZ2404291.1 HlyC/CorC family transporter [Paenarthrobacter sp. Z7-10]
MGLVFVAIAAVLTAAEAAFNYFPRHDAEAVAARGHRTSLLRILSAPVAHMNALRFWRVWFEMAAAVTVAVLFLNLLHNVWIAGLLATAVMAGIGFVLVGVSPRQWGRLHSAAVVGATSKLVRFLCWVLGPIPGWLVELGSTVAPGAPRGDDAFVSEEEFREFVDRASESEMIEDNEAELIQSVFELGDTLVRAVMVPRTDIVSVDEDTSLEDALTLFLLSGYSRIPVIGENTDQIRGILYLKDVVAVAHRLPPGEAAPPLASIARGVRYVPESKQVSDLLKELQQESTHVAIVIDEYGGTAGLVTLEDLIEEIVGEIVDEYDSEAPEVQNLGQGKYRVSAQLGIDNLGELFGLDLADDEVDTVGGLLAKYLGRVPIVGSEAEVEGIRLHAERLEGRRNRVSHIIATRSAPADTEIAGLMNHSDSAAGSEL